MKKEVSYHFESRLHMALLLAVKIGVGSAIAIWVADWLGLESPTAAGTITLLTLLNTKWKTIELMYRRIFSFFITLFICVILFAACSSQLMAFSLFLIIIVFITEVLDWENTLSVNALIGMHFLTSAEISADFIMNEFFLLLIGIFMAFILNLYQDRKRKQKQVIKCMEDTEESMRALLSDLSLYIKNPDKAIHPFDDIKTLETKMGQYQQITQDLVMNTFSEGYECLQQFFVMRQRQLEILKNLHAEIRLIRTMPLQAALLSEYIDSLIPSVKSHKAPAKELEELEELLHALKQEYSFDSQQEFEDRAILIHVFMDLEDFLQLKTNFILSLNDVQTSVFYSVQQDCAPSV